MKKSTVYTMTARTFFVRAVSVSIINQFKLHDSFCLCLASVHLPYPLHWVFCFQLLGHAVLLCRLRHDRFRAVSCDLFKPGAIRFTDTGIMQTARFFFYAVLTNQYIPPMPGFAAGAAGATGSFLSATTLSVVSTMEATDAAFSSAERVTFAGSTIPAANISTYCS